VNPRSENLLLKDTTCIILDPPSIESCDLRLADGEIVERKGSLKARKGETVVDLGGRVVMPGFVCSHTHLYSALSRGMPPPRTSPKDFVQILQDVWWKLDEALDEESIYYSALVGAIEAVKRGTTSIVDHHASPNSVAGSLDEIKKALSSVGVRGILCYETTDRGGKKRRDLGLEENARFLMENTTNANFRGTLGAHASFTLTDDSMRQLGELAELHDTGVHIHVAEDKADVIDCERTHKTGLIDRLDKFGLLRQRSILVHGVHLNAKELSRVDKTGAWMIHNPRSNMNNSVGYPRVASFGKRAALGTDGFVADMFEESSIGYFRNAESDQRIPFARIPTMLQNGQKLVSEYFGKPFGTLKPGSPADLVVLDYFSPTPISIRNLHAHFLFGMSSPHVRHVMTNGAWTVWDRRLTMLDEENVMKQAAVIARRLWKRMDATRA
jgi:putative selenium metabolism protein SsnA